MSVTQRSILLVGAVAVLMVGMFPPWKYVYNAPALPSFGRSNPRPNPEPVERNAGYRFIGTPPEPGDAGALGKLFGDPEVNYLSLPYFSTQLNSTVFGFELLSVVLITLLLYFAAGARKKDELD
jgi:hypothetical protein